MFFFKSKYQNENIIYQSIMIKFTKWFTVAMGRHIRMQKSNSISFLEVFPVLE